MRDAAYWLIVAAWAYFFAIRGYYEQVVKRGRATEREPPSVEPLHETAIVFLVVSIGSLSPLAWAAFFHDHGHRHAAATLLWLGAALFHWVHFALGLNWFKDIRIRPNGAHTVARHGAYAFVRHPMYTSFLVFSLGSALLWTGTMAITSYAALLASALVFLRRARAEEALLAKDATIGAAYRAYLAATPYRFVPYLA